MESHSTSPTMSSSPLLQGDDAELERLLSLACASRPIPEAQGPTRVYQVDPLSDPRWDPFIRAHPRATVFHTRGWLQALKLFYGYLPVAFTTSATHEEFGNAAVFCEVQTWLTPRRLVSLPFSDHCEPLVRDPQDAQAILSYLTRHTRRWGYIEMRPRTGFPRSRPLLNKSESYCLHLLDLSADLETILHRMHADCVRRKIRRARREGVTCERGNSPQLLREFYDLQVATRRRHGVPPQPFGWFAALAHCLGEDFTIWAARRNGTPLASMITLGFRGQIVYKYGASDSAHHNLGSVPLLMWEIIEHAKTHGYRELDLGRSALDQEGLLRFKDNLGAQRMILDYQRYPAGAGVTSPKKLGLRMGNWVLARTPDWLLVSVGELLYRHSG
jgi:GNAT acetyltransferase-like protein